MARQLDPAFRIYGSTGRIVCKGCRRGYGSKLDGICTNCRGMTAWEYQEKERAAIGHVWWDRHFDPQHQRKEK